MEYKGNTFYMIATLWYLCQEINFPRVSFCMKRIKGINLQMGEGSASGGSLVSGRLLLELMMT